MTLLTTWAAAANDPVYSINTLSANITIPLGCDVCEHTEGHSIEYLRRLPTLTCHGCADTRQFSTFELTTLENTLHDLGYAITNA